MYAHFVSPIVEPRQLTAQEPLALDYPQQESIRRFGAHDAIAEEFLPDLAWAKNAANQFQIGDMFVYANKIEQHPGKSEMRFEPFAMVWKNPKAKPGEAPLRVIAEAAVVQFESAINLTGDKPGRPVFGALEGAVRIEGPNGLLLIGRGFTFSEQALRLWSDSDILFHYGPHHGTGHGLQVDFLPASEQQVVQDQPRLGGLRSVAVLRQVALTLMGEAAESGIPRRSPLKAGDRLNVDSDGRMQYDFEANLITFDHNVRVRHPLPDKQEEGINCDLLTLVLSNPPVKQAPGGDPSVAPGEIAQVAAVEPAERSATKTATRPGMAGWLPENLSLDKLLADGTGKRRVELFSQSRDLHCNTAQVEYDLVKRVVNLRDPATVDVLNGAHQIHAPEIMLAFQENNQDLRLAIARGAGNASSRLADGRMVTANWLKQLVKSFDPQSQRDIVEVQGEGAIGLGMEYELKGDALRLEITPLTMNAKPDGPAPADKTPPRIERVAGVGQVVLKSPQATAHTKWLDVQFQSAALPPAAPGAGSGLFGLQEPAKPAGPPRAGPRGKPPAATESTPLDVKAESIRALVLRDTAEPTRMALSELWADKAVTVTQPLKPGQPPVQVLGNQLHVESILPSQQLVQVTGTPAMIRSDVSRLEGRDIRLDRERNTLHVHSGGVLQYPVNTSLDGQPLERAQLLQVKWAERLAFNGQTADFYEKVEASLGHMVMRCNAMHVSLATPLRFDSPQLQKLAPHQMQLARVYCENKVELDSAEYQGNIIISRSFGRLGQFVVDNISGKTEAQGPGYFMEWRRGQAAGDNRLTPAKAAKPIANVEKSSEWTYSRIDFQGRMKGNVRERFTAFEDHVEIVYGPVQHATDRIEADSLPEGAASITCDTLKVEQFAETEAAPAFVKLRAEGNTKLELEWDGHPFHAQADEVKFDESKDYYLLRSIGTQKVMINREPTTLDPRAFIKCSRVDIRNPRDPSRREFKVHQATVLNGVQPGG